MPCLQLFYVSVESFFTGSYLQFCTVKVETFFRARVYSYSILVLWAVFTILLTLILCYLGKIQSHRKFTHVLYVAHAYNCLWESHGCCRQLIYGAKMQQPCISWALTCACEIDDLKLHLPGIVMPKRVPITSLHLILGHVYVITSPSFIEMKTASSYYFVATSW